jgi:ribosomal protein L31
VPRRRRQRPSHRHTLDIPRDASTERRRPTEPRNVAEENPVKPDIHPKYYEAKVHCGSCGTEWTVGSTRPELRVDVCSNCHPFFTGKQTIIDTAGQVERFQRRLERQIRS